MANNGCSAVCRKIEKIAMPGRNSHDECAADAIGAGTPDLGIDYALIFNAASNGIPLTDQDRDAVQALAHQLLQENS